MTARDVRLIGLTGLPEILPGTDLVSLIVDSASRANLTIQAHDIFVVTQKIVSKSEGRIVDLEDVHPSAVATEWATQLEKDARLVEVILRETVRIVRMDRGILIAETRQGFVCANAGVDGSNVSGAQVTLLPADPDASAQRLCAELKARLGCSVGVIISDTFGRPWREGLVNVALGVAGLAPLVDYRGQVDAHGHSLHVTRVAIADELACAAELVMGKTAGIPVVVIRGIDYKQERGTGRELIRRPESDLFR